MDPLSLLVLLVLGTLAGAVNAAVGSGSLLTLPVLLALGVPPGTAVRTNTIGILFSTIGSVTGYRREIAAEGRALVPLIEDMRSYGRRWLPVDEREPVGAAL